MKTRLLLLLVLIFVLAGCAPAEPAAPRLRILNAGDLVVENLSVLFPEDEIFFGDVLPGATTEYLPAPNGVYRYAAYRYEIDGEIVLQPVIDWVGEEPLPGQDFTYTIDFDPARVQLLDLQLLDVRVDE